MSLKYEPSSEPLHISASIKYLDFGAGGEVDDDDEEEGRVCRIQTPRALDIQGHLAHKKPPLALIRAKGYKKLVSPHSGLQRYFLNDR